MKTLQRRAKDLQLVTYSQITDDNLDSLVRDILLQYPTSGEVMLNGHLLSRNVRVQRARLRSCIGRVRGRQSTYTPISRGVYSVPGPNCLWHADGNHKLIRYRLVVHAAIDGFSRLLTFINCADNNRADTVLQHFLKGTAEFGVPSRLRTDKGGENVGLWRYMDEVRGEGRSSYIAGSSVHNSRIERLWRDVRSNVLATFSTIFHALEDAGVLDPENESDLFFLHYNYIYSENKQKPYRIPTSMEFPFSVDRMQLVPIAIIYSLFFRKHIV